MKGFKRYIVIVSIILFVSMIASAVLYILEIDELFLFISLIVCAVDLGLIFPSFIFYKRVKQNAYQEQKLQLWNSISYRVKKAGETSFNEMPLGIILFNDEFVIEWANIYAKKIFESELVERELSKLNKEFANLISKREPVFNITIYDKVYHVEHILRDHVLYLTDITKETGIINRYKERTLALGILNLDNLDLTMSTIDAQEKALHMSRLIGLLTDWSEENDVCLKGYSEERYMLIMDSKTLDKIIKKGFDILASVKAYCSKEGLRITASIGIVCDDNNAVELMEDATNQLELALSRGGNQAIVKRDGKTLYFGARSEAFEGRTATNIRVKTEELVDLIRKHKNVFILGHRYMDADAFGGCLVASKIALACGAKPKIIIDEEYIDATVKEIYSTLKYSYASSINEFVSGNNALKEIKDNDLLIIIDCQYQKLLMNDRVYRKAKHIAIIDHHRRNTEAILNFDFIYTQPSASSSVELLVEMLDYVDEDKYEITPDEATWMIMGVLVDTNNFMFHTTYRTFNVLSKLQKFGAEMGKVQKYLRENKEEYIKKVSILNNLEIIEGGYGIVCCDDEIYERAFIAKIADNVCTVGNVKASFCIGRYTKDGVSISARSLDEENVQVIMEKLGGGGHYTTAAVQFEGCTILQAKERLLEVLKQNVSEGEQVMKIILIKDVKGKGKANDILDIPMGHANHLMRSGQAIEATPDNLKKLEADKMKEKQLEAKHLEDMQDLKEKIDALTVKVSVKVGTNGKLFGTVSTKEVCEKFKEQNGIELDKRKIMYDNQIDALGTYKLPIQLHKEVIATITLYVVEGK